MSNQTFCSGGGHLASVHTDQWPEGLRLLQHGTGTRLPSVQTKGKEAVPTPGFMRAVHSNQLSWITFHTNSAPNWKGITS